MEWTRISALLLANPDRVEPYDDPILKHPGGHLLNPGKKRTDNAAVVPILFWGHKNLVSSAAAAALALDDLSVGHTAASGEEGEGGSAETKCCAVNINVK